MPKLRGRHGLLRVGAPIVIFVLEPDGGITTSGPYHVRNAVWHVVKHRRECGQRVWVEADGVSARRPGVRTSRGRRG